jgi:hypothetical protein
MAACLHARVPRQRLELRPQRRIVALELRHANTNSTARVSKRQTRNAVATLKFEAKPRELINNPNPYLRTKRM